MGERDLRGAAPENARHSARKSAPVFLRVDGVRRGLGTVLALAAIVVALALTAYAAIDQWAPEVLSPLPVRLDIESNLESGVVFFWLELLAVVAGVRLYDRATRTAEHRRKLAAKFQSISASLEKVIERVWAERLKFAEALDANPTSYGSYDVHRATLNACMVEIRNDFLSAQLRDDGLTDHTRLIVDRVLRVLDRMVEESFEVGGRIDALHAALQASAPEDHGGDEATPRVAQNGQDTGMDDLLNELFNVVDPEKQGLERLSSAIAESFDALRLGKSSRGRPGTRG